MIDEEEDIYAFLEHHGVRGMRWGVRRARSPSGKVSKKPLTSQEKAVRRNKVIGVAMVTVGAALAANMLAGQYRTMKVRSAANIYNPKTNVKIAQQINDIISMNTGVRTVTLAKSLGR